MFAAEMAVGIFVFVDHWNDYSGSSVGRYNEEQYCKRGGVGRWTGVVIKGRSKPWSAKGQAKYVRHNEVLSHYIGEV